MQRRRLLGLAPAIIATVSVDQFRDPIARNAQLPAQNGLVFRRQDWRLMVAYDQTPRPCETCNQTHAVGGTMIYTIGCSPAAQPVGWAINSGIEALEIPIGLSPHPIGLGGCPDPAYMPHQHDGVRWE